LSCFGVSFGVGVASFSTVIFSGWVGDGVGGGEL